MSKNLDMTGLVPLHTISRKSESGDQKTMNKYNILIMECSIPGQSILRATIPGREDCILPVVSVQVPTEFAEWVAFMATLQTPNTTGKEVHGNVPTAGYNDVRGIPNTTRKEVHSLGNMWYVIAYEWISGLWPGKYAYLHKDGSWNSSTNKPGDVSPADPTWAGYWETRGQAVMAMMKSGDPEWMKIVNESLNF